MRIPLLLAVLFGTCLLAGYGIGSLRSQPDKVADLPNDGASVSEPRSLATREQGIDFGAGNSGYNELLSTLVTAAKEQDYLKGRVAMYRQLERLSSSEVSALLDSAQRLPSKLRRTVMAAIIDQWLKVDATAAGAWISSRSNDFTYLAAWAAASPREALTSLLASKQTVWYWDAPKIAMERLAGKDPQARISLLISLPASINRDKFLAWEIHELAKTNPADAWKAANTSLAGKDRTAATRLVLQEWAKVDPKAAIAQLESFLPEVKPGLRGDELISYFTRNLAEKDPAAALDFAANLPDELRKYPLIAAASAWAKTDPLGALKWSLENEVAITTPFRAGGYTAADTVLRSALKAQPEEAIRWLIELPASQERQQILRSAFSEQMMKDDAAKSILSGYASPVLRLFREFTPDEQKSVAGGLGWKVAKDGTFPDDAKWKSLFPNEEIRTRAMAGAVGVIFGQSVARGEAILAQFSEGPVRDMALKEAVFAQAYATPDLAVKRALEIKSKDMQRSALDRAIPSWLQRDEAACRAWLESAKEFPASWVAEWITESKMP